MSTLIQRESVDTDAVVIGRSFRTPEVFGKVFDRHWDSVYIGTAGLVPAPPERTSLPRRSGWRSTGVEPMN
jgi:hypothetical protein